MRLFIVDSIRYWVPEEEVVRFEEFLADEFRTDIDSWLPLAGTMSENYSKVLSDWADRNWTEFAL